VPGGQKGALARSEHETKQIRDSLGCSGSGAGASQTLGRRSLERAAELRRKFASGSSIATDREWRSAGLSKSAARQLAIRGGRRALETER
jgi:hypothetical protein